MTPEMNIEGPEVQGGPSAPRACRVVPTLFPDPSPHTGAFSNLSARAVTLRLPQASRWSVVIVAEWTWQLRLSEWDRVRLGSKFLPGAVGGSYEPYGGHAQDCEKA